MDTQTQIERLIELAIIQRSELKQLVEQLPQLREHLNAEVEKVFEETEPQLRAELEDWTTKQAADKTAALGVALEAKIGELSKNLEISTQARYNAIIAEREENSRLAAEAEAKIAEHAASLPSAVKEIVSAELARFPRAGEIDQLRKEFAEPRGLNPRGKWQAGETYNRLDLVTVNGDSFVSNIDGNKERPSRTAANWTLSAARGMGGGSGFTSLNNVLGDPTAGQIVGSEGGQYVRKTLVAGANITINETATDITIVGDEGEISLEDGTAASPALFFTNDPDTGIYRPAANTLGISVSGTQVAYFDENGLTVPSAGVVAGGSIHAGNGNANNPSLSFDGDQDTGFFRHQADGIAIALGGTQYADFHSSGFSITPSVTIVGGLRVNGTTDSSSKDTGAIITEGGLGVEKSASIGGNLTVSGSGTVNSPSGTSSGLLVKAFNTAGGNVQQWADFQTSTGLTLARFLRGNGASGYDANGLSIDSYEGLRVNLNALGGSGGAFTIAGGNLTVSGTGTNAFSGNAQFAEGKGVVFNNSSNAGSYGLAYANATPFPIRLAINNDPITQRRFQVGYYSDNTTAGTWTNSFEVNSYSGNVSMGGNLTVSGGTITGGTTGLSLAAGGTNQNITLTPSGTGVNTLNGGTTFAASKYLRFGTQFFALGESNTTYLFSGGAGGYIFRNGNDTATLAALTNTGNFLIGGSIDGGQKLQVNGDATFAGNVTAVKSGTAFYSIESTVNGAISEVIVKGKNSTGTAREARLGINKYADDVFSIYDGTTERFRLGLTTGDATFAGRVTPTGGIVGVTTNSNAAAGNVGEIVTAVVDSGSGVALTSTVVANATGISLTAGDWDVTGVVGYDTSGATVSQFLQGLNNASASLGPTGTLSKVAQSLSGDTNNWYHMVPTYRFSLSATSTVYLLARATFSAGTVSAFGAIRARRVR